MRPPHPSRPARAALLALLPAVLLLAAPAARAQTFGVGAGGGILNDAGSAEDLKNFSTGAFFAYGEMVLDEGILMQVRYTRMQLPPSGENGPNIDVDAATITIAYLFNQDWWRAGFVAGAGGYWLNPRSPSEGQVETDRAQSVSGLTGGLLTIFAVNPRLDIRLEAMGNLIRDENRRKPVIVGASVTWKF
jgi:hypothetical protein